MFSIYYLILCCDIIRGETSETASERQISIHLRQIIIFLFIFFAIRGIFTATSGTHSEIIYFNFVHTTLKG